MALLDSRYTQVGFNLISVQVCCHDESFICSASGSVYQRFGGGAAVGAGYEGGGGGGGAGAATSPSGGGGGGGTTTATDGSFCGDTYLPLVTSDRKQFLPIPYLRQSETVGVCAEAILRQWLDVRVLDPDAGLVVAVQKIQKPPLLVAQMTEEWLNHYRKLA